MKVDLLDLRAVTPEGACQPRGVRGRDALGEQSIAALDLGPVGAESAGQRDVQQEQIVERSRRTTNAVGVAAQVGTGLTLALGATAAVLW